MFGLRAQFGSQSDACEMTFSDGELVVDLTDCDGDGDLATDVDCRERVIDALTRRDADVIRLKSAGVERMYDGESAALLTASGRFVEQVEFRDERLAKRARRDPLAAAREAVGRTGAVADIAAETGLAELSVRVTDYETALTHTERPTVSRWRVERLPPPETALSDVRELDTGATVREYRSDRVAHYHLAPLESTLSNAELELLAQAYDLLATGDIEGGTRAPARAVRAVVSDYQPSETDHQSDKTDQRTSSASHQSSNIDQRISSVGHQSSNIDQRISSTDHQSRDIDDQARPTDTANKQDVPIETITQVLEKHTQGYGLLSDIFTDPVISDVFLTAPAPENPVTVTANGESLVTNIRPTERCIEALASRFRRESGRAFSRAEPTLDATTVVGNRRVRIAGVTDPTSNGTAFTFRVQDRNVWTLPALVANGTLTPRAAALLSVAVERGAALLSAGARGSGKTTLLGALLFELPPGVRTVVIEDTPELPVRELQATGRDVQALLAGTAGGELSPSEALRTALRLGNGALVVGEVRGEEAQTLYEAMRVGAHSEAVLGTIHGDGGDAVYERVVSDLGVPPTSFGVTDLLITLERTRDGRRVRRIEEVVGNNNPKFKPLISRGETLEPTGRVDRGNSHLVQSIARPEESYAEVRACITKREQLVETLAARGTIDGDTVTESHSCR